MEENYINIYKKCRNLKGMTQERAAEHLNVSIDSLKAYESGKTPVPNQVAAEMVRVYGVDYLAIQHLQENPVGATAIPKFDTGANLSESILGLIKEANDVVSLTPSLINIGADGKIDESEQELLCNIINEINELQQAIMKFKYSDKGGY